MGNNKKKCDELGLGNSICSSFRLIVFDRGGIFSVGYISIPCHTDVSASYVDSFVDDSNHTRADFCMSCKKTSRMIVTV